MGYIFLQFSPLKCDNDSETLYYTHNIFLLYVFL